MKSLALSLLLLFLIGTLGDDVADQTRGMLKRMYKNAFLLKVELQTMLDSPYPEKIALLEEGVAGVMLAGYYVVIGGWTYASNAIEEARKETEQQFPVFKSQMKPILEKSQKKYINYLWSLKKDLLPTVKEAFSEIMKQQRIFGKKVMTFFERDEEKLKALHEETKSNLRPYVDRVKLELEEAKKKHVKMSDQERYTSIALYSQVKENVGNYTQIDTMVNQVEKLSN